MVMAWVWRALRTVLDESKGITSLEYAVLAVGIVLVVAVAAKTLGTDISSLFTTIGNSL